MRGCGPIHGTEMMMTNLLIDESFLFEQMKNSDRPLHIVSNLKLLDLVHYFYKSDIYACQIRFNVTLGVKLSPPFNIR